MLKDSIAEAVANMVEKTILRKQHGGSVDYFCSDEIRVEIDGKKYSIKITEIEGE